MFRSPDDAGSSLRSVGYLTDTATATTVYLAATLERPLLVEGPAGVGKTELAKSVAAATGAELVRLQCYEGLDEARALYEWNYKKQLLRIQTNAASDSGSTAWEQTHDDIFTDEFLLTRPLLTAIRRDGPTVLLIDEADKTNVEVEAMLLEVLAEFQVTIPELGTVVASRRPFVVITSNATRELSEALKRRCLYLYLDYPSAERERDILLERVPSLEADLAEQVVRVVDALRALELKKAPSVSETIDWARTLLALGIGKLDETATAATLNVVLKHHSDLVRAAKELELVTTEHHIAFVDALRGGGLTISLAEALDAAAAVRTAPIGDREVLRAVYAATLVKRQTYRPVFEEMFDLYFPRVLGAGVVRPDQPRAAPPSWETSDADRLRLREELRTFLLTGDDADLADLAREAVARLGALPGSGPGAGSGGRPSWSRMTVLDRLSPQTLLAGLLDAFLGAGERGGMAEQLARAAIAERVRRFEQLVAADVRRRMAEQTSVAAIAASGVRRAVEEISFLSATRAELAEIRRAIAPLARKLAARVAIAHRHGRQGQLDFRRTIRASLSTGGVPVATHHRPCRPHKTDLVVICDLSQSVTSFAHFTLLLVYALREQFSRVRAFGFVDDMDEVTRFFAPGGDVLDAVTRLSREARVNWLLGRTDYGRAFELFHERYLDAVGPRTSVLVLGDARSNYGQLGLPACTALAARARHAYWLNPERRTAWDTGDSAASRYGAIVPMIECRNLAQLSAFVKDLPV